MDPVNKILGISKADIERVETIDSWAQQHNSALDKKLSMIYGFADKDAQGYGWKGIAKKNPEIFKQALNATKGYR